MLRYQHYTVPDRDLLLHHELEEAVNLCGVRTICAQLGIEQGNLKSYKRRLVTFRIRLAYSDELVRWSSGQI